MQLLRRQLIEHAASPLGRVSASAGIAVGHPALDASTPENLMAAADRALYQAKQQGRDGYTVAGNMAMSAG